MPTPFSSDDLGRVFDARTLTRGRSLLLLGAVEVGIEGDSVTGVVDQAGTQQTVTLTPRASGSRVALDARCTCQAPACVHAAAAAFAALERFPALRKAEAKGLLDTLTTDEAPEKRIVMFELAAAPPPEGCFVSTFLVGERTRRIVPTTPRQVSIDPGSGAPARALARLLGAGTTTKTTVPRGLLPEVLRQLVATGAARWAASGKRLQDGEPRTFDAHLKPKLPPKSAVLQSDSGPFYVDGSSGAVGRVRLRQRAPEPVRPRRPEPVSIPATASDGAIVEAELTPIIRLRRVKSSDALGRISLLDALTLDFDYGGVLVAGHDERQFIRVMSPAGPSFVRRDTAAEEAAFNTLGNDGFTQMRIAEPGSSKGRRALVHVGPDAAERWHHFIAARIPQLQVLGWRNLIDRDFGPRLVEEVGTADVQVEDAGPGRFSLDFGIEIDGVRLPLLPILSKLIERGGLEAAQIVDGEIITSLDDGRVVKLPADRIRRLLAIMGDLIEGAGRLQDGPLVLPTAEAATVLELEDLVNTRFESAAAIRAYVEQFRDEAEIAPVLLPGDFKGDLRPYQQHGLDWLQHLRGHGLGGFLADDMGLGKTAQTIAHLVFEHAAGRLDRPALIVVPTSLIGNWTAELTKFAPHLRTAVLHGMDRHARRDQLAGVHVVITTYTVLARDIEEMRELGWHIVVLDEAQAIKSPDAKATRAVVPAASAPPHLPVRHADREQPRRAVVPVRLPDAGAAGGAAGASPSASARRSRRRGRPAARCSSSRRIRPFILRRTKAEVATELPPKHTILRRITLAPEQRELYETIRATLHEQRAGASRGAAAWPAAASSCWTRC